VGKSKKFVAPYGSSENVLSDGRVLIPGEPVELDDDALKDEHNQRLIEDGQIAEVQDKKPQHQATGGE
jgi:hypothetical protein